MVSGGGDVEVGMSPLVAGITDSLLQLVLLDAPPQLVSGRCRAVGEWQVKGSW